ncbi:MAG: lactonase family protein [Pirellulales bacterium]
MNITRLVAAGLISLAAATAVAAPPSYLMYVGTYTGGKSRGIYAFHFDPASGKLAPLGLAAEVKSPSYLAVHPSGMYVYAVSEIDDFAGKKTGGVAAKAIDKATGKLTKLNDAPSGSGGPCFVTVDKAGRHVLVANYGGGTVSAIAIDDDGKLAATTAHVKHAGSSVDPARQEAPHAHSINLDAANRFAIAADLGLDELLVYRFDADKGTLTPNDPPHTKIKPGSGPRHFAFHPSGRIAYAINEINCTMTALEYDADKGTLGVLQTLSTLRPDEKYRSGWSTADVHVHPSGKFLYGSNRGHDTIVVYKIDADKGTLTYVENQSTRGKTPRNFAIDPTGKWLLAENQSSDTIAVFSINQDSGKLKPVGDLVECPSPVCIQFVAE